MKKNLIVLMSFLILTSCDDQKPQAVTETSNNQFTVEFLFEHEGVKVYRFKADGNWVYYTNRIGDTTEIEAKHHTTMVGKTIVHSVTYEPETVSQR